MRFVGSLLVGIVTYLGMINAPELTVAVLIAIIVFYTRRTEIDVANLFLRVDDIERRTKDPEPSGKSLNDILGKALDD